jgi:ATP-binding cassette subfamily F protein uup
LAYHEKRELELLPSKIELLEGQITELNQVMVNPEFYKQPRSEIVDKQLQLKKLESELSTAYKTWEVLEQLQG